MHTHTHTQEEEEEEEEERSALGKKYLDTSKQHHNSPP